MAECALANEIRGTTNLSAKGRTNEVHRRGLVVEQ
jgi:hypothetical protein